MTLPTPTLENPTSKTFRTSPPIPPLKGGGLGWGGEGDKHGQNPRTFPHLSAPQIDKVRNGGNQPIGLAPISAHSEPRRHSAKTVANCHRHAVEAIRAAMWTRPIEPTPQAEMRAAILSRLNTEGQPS